MNKALLMGCIIGGVGIIALTLVLLFTVGPFAHSAEDATQSESALTENSAQGDSAHEGDNGEGQGNGASKQGGTEGDTADNALDGALDDKPKAGTDISQQENVVYDTLTEAYADLGELDADIKESAARFNADHLNPNALLRAEEADAAYELLQEAQELKREFGLLHVPENSVNKTQAELIGNCIDDCIERIRVICNAWDVSLSFADPNDHEEDILAPIQDANDSGRSIPLEDFNEKYPQARPVKP